MRKEAKPIDPQSVFCEVCAKRVPKSEAVVTEGRDHTAYFCSSGCYERWRGERAPAPPPHEVQEGAGRSKSRDERLSQIRSIHGATTESRQRQRDELLRLSRKTDESREFAPVKWPPASSSVQQAAV
jgi:hypothetical protein